MIDIASPIIKVTKELKVLRRPLSAAILDDGSTLSVLASNHQVNIYDLSDVDIKRTRSISLDNSSHTIALSPRGEVVAAAYDSGIEVHSLTLVAPATNQRAVKCDRVDSLAFSNDGTILIGSTNSSKPPNTVILSAPYFNEIDQDLPQSELISQMWTSQILFPNSSRDCSHAILLPHPTEGDTGWTFTFDRVFESFRAVRTDDLRNGTNYFVGPQPVKPSKSKRRRSKTKLIPCTLPSPSERGDLVAAGFAGRDVWLYGVPESLDAPPIVNSDESSSSRSSVPGPSTARNLEEPRTPTTAGGSPELQSLPRWQVLVDKYRNVFAKGRRVAQVSGMASMCWVSRDVGNEESRSNGERLVISAPGGVSGPAEIEEDQPTSVDGGRLLVLDFNRAVVDGEVSEHTIEVGQVDPKVLEEENVDMATEIAIVRRRTVRREVQDRRSVVDALRPVASTDDEVPAVPPLPDTNTSVGFGLDHTVNDAPQTAEAARSLGSPSNGLNAQEVFEALDGPYANTQPRSRNTLYQSATAVAANRDRLPPRIPDDGHVTYRRPDGRGELPHESDADDWSPPPPPYTPNPEIPLPEHLRQSMIPQSTAPVHEAGGVPSRPSRARTTREQPASPIIQRNSLSIDRLSRIPRRPVPERSNDIRSSLPLSEQPEGWDTIGRLDFSNPLPPIPPQAERADIIPQDRHISVFERRRSMITSRLSRRLNSPISPLSEPAFSEGNSLGQAMSLPSSPSRSASADDHTSSGNVSSQRELEDPLPVLHEANVDEDSSELARPVPRSNTGTLAFPSSSSIGQQVTTVMPSAQQLANLQNRFSEQSSPRGRPAGVPAPPRGAIGAAGSSTTPTRLSTEAPARALSRSNAPKRTGSPGHERSRSLSSSSSSPNLLRPAAHRMDTIYSIASAVSRTRTKSRDPPEITRPATSMSGFETQMRSYSVDGARPMEKKKHRRTWLRGRKEVPGEISVARHSQTWPLQEEPRQSAEEKKKKDSKCVLM